jgi:hypothetical protein
MSIIMWTFQATVVIFTVLALGIFLHCLLISPHGLGSNTNVPIFGLVNGINTFVYFLGLLASLSIYTYFHILFKLKSKRILKCAPVANKTIDNVIVCGYCKCRNPLDTPNCKMCAGPLGSSEA